MHLSKIVVATDFSPQSDAALRHGARLARSSGGDLRVVHVLETPAEDEGLESSQPSIEQWRIEDQAQLAREIESETSGKLDVAPQVVEALSTAEGLQEIVEAHGADLIVVGSTGASQARQALLGSTAQKVLRAVEAHVMVARGETPPSEGYGRILVPTDFSEASEKAVELASALAAPNAQCDLVHFWRVPEATRSDEHSQLVIDAVAKSVAQRGQKLMETCAKIAPETKFHSAQTSPERGIARKLEEGDYDLVVVGSYGRSKLRRWLLGSVAEYTARTAPCSVAVARPD